MASARLFCVAALLVTVPSLPVLFAQNASSAAGQPAVAANLDVLLQQIEASNPEDIGRDSVGDVVSVVLRQGRATDDNLSLISTLDSLRRIALEPARRAKPTQQGIETLSRLTNLVSLQLACCGALPDGVFNATCGLKRLRCLNLCAAYPPASEYYSITNLQDLAELHVTYCTNFGDSQLTVITNLPNLRSIELRADALSGHATNILSGMRTLTNVVTKVSWR